MPNKENHKKPRVVKVVKPYKESTMRLYAIWKTIPTAFKRLTVLQLKEMGYEEDEFAELIQVRTKTEFAEKYKCDRTHLNDWDNSEPFKKMVDEINLQSNVLRFKKDIDSSFTRKTIKEGDAARTKLWKQLYEDWNEKTQVEHGATKELMETIQKINDLIDG